MKENVRLSIIVPCYKVEKYLPRCLDSLLNQTLGGVEIICINDGSPDHCIDILNEYKRKFGDKLVIVDKKNEGVWRGRKDGIKLAKGEFIGFVDSDDYVTLDYAEKLYKKAKEQNADIAVCGFDRVDMITGKLYSREMCKPSNKIIEVNQDAGALLEMNGAPWNKIYKAELLKNMADLEHPPQILDDIMFLLLIYINAKRVAFINESLVYYQVRKDSIINTIKKEQLSSVYRAMLEVREVYNKSYPNKDMLIMLDGMAFLHLGVSLMFRLSYDNECNLKEAIRKNNKYMSRYFKTWKHNKFITFHYVLSHKFTNFKLWIIKTFYTLHKFTFFLKVYRFVIDKLGIDIKW